MKPLIGITAGEVKNIDHPWEPVTYGQRYTYFDAIIHAGGLPVMLPLSTDTNVLLELASRLDGILFAGGNDLDPKLYHEQPYPTVIDLSALRDMVEVQLMRQTLEGGKPLLAICRGMQLLNVVKGGSLYQDIKTDLPKASDHTDSSTAKDIQHIAHKLRIKPGSKLAEILQATQVKANTHHHQAVKNLGSDLEAAAWAEDDIVEAIEVPGVPFVVGVQAHPESLEAQAEPIWQNLFKSFVQAATKK